MSKLKKIDLNILKEYKRTYRPYNNYNVDYQTDAPSYYDYLGNLNNIFTSIIESLNQQIDYVNAINNKDIKVEDTETIKLLMEGDFKVDNQILLKGRLRTSNEIETRKYNERTFDIRNAVIQKSDGIYVRDYTDVITYLQSLIDENNKIINEHNTKILALEEQDEQIDKNIGYTLDRINEVSQRVDKITSSGDLAKNEDLKNLRSEVTSLQNELSELSTTVNAGFSSIARTQTKTNEAIRLLNDRINAIEG